MEKRKINSVMEFITENEVDFKCLSINNMIKRKDEIFLIELAIKLGADIHEKEDEAVFSAMERKDSLKILQLLKKSGMKFNTDTAAMATCRAIESKNIETIEFLIKNGVDVHWDCDRIIKTVIRMTSYDESKPIYDILKVVLNAKTY